MYIYNKYVLKSFFKSFTVCVIFFLFITFIGTFLDEQIAFKRAFFLSSFELLYILDIVFLFSGIIFFVTTKSNFNYDIIRFYGKRQVRIFANVYYFILFVSFLVIFLIKPIVVKKIQKTDIDKKSEIELALTQKESSSNSYFMYLHDKDIFVVLTNKSVPQQIILSNSFKKTNDKLILRNVNILDVQSGSVSFEKEKSFNVEIGDKNIHKTKYKIETIYSDVMGIVEDFTNLYKKKTYIYSSLNVIKELNLIILSIFNFNLIIIFLAKFSRMKNLVTDTSKVVFVFFVTKNFIKFLQSLYLKYGQGLFISTMCALILMAISFYKIEKSEYGG